MPSERRGQATKERLLEEACRVFAEEGYRDATHARICKNAQANVAAINYYFESKESLYRQVFHHLLRKAEALYPLDGGLPENTTPEVRLRAYIHAHLRRIFDPERLGCMHRIFMAERFEPTGLLVKPMREQLSKNRSLLHHILRGIMGGDVSQKEVEWCEMSIISQCFIAAPIPDKAGEGPRVIFGLHHGEIDNLTDHIFTFSLAGVYAISRREPSKKA